MKLLHDKLSGIMLTAVLAVPTWLAGKAAPIIGGPVFGIMLGMALAYWVRPQQFNSGINFTSKKILQLAVILLGFEMNLYSILSVGRETLFLMGFTLTGAFLTAAVAGRLLGLNRNMKVLIGVGTAICGGSAIAAAAPVINAQDEEVAQAISTVFLFNVAAAFLFPMLGHALGMNDHTFGLWAGTAVNDTSSVVAAGYSFSDKAGELAVIVKLTRALIIVPVTLVLAVWASGKPAAGQNGRWQIVKIFPWFIGGFVAAAVLNTYLQIPHEVSGILAQGGKFGIVMAMVAIGLNTHLPRLIAGGVKPILLGLVAWVVLSATSLGMLYAMANY